MPLLRDRVRSPFCISPHGAVNMIHRFRPGQRVRLSRGTASRNLSEGSCEIIRRLPYEDGEYRYRIKSAHEQHERVVKESDLEAA